MTRTRLVLALAAAVTCVSPVAEAAQATYPASAEGDFVVRDYVFTSGDRMLEVKIHYRTVGTPRKDADGVVRNGVLMQDLIKQVKKGRFVLLPITDATRGHGTHSIPAIWGGELVKFMAGLR